MKTLIDKALIIVILFVVPVSTVYAAHTCPAEPGCTTDQLNVPGDFPPNTTGDFTMELLSGNFEVYDPLGVFVSTGSLNNLTQIDFTASAFDGIGPGEGSSIINTTISNYAIGSFLPTADPAVPATFYINGPGTGTLADNAGSTAGQWTLTVPMFVNFSSVDYDLGNVTFGTVTNFPMDYHTGDALLRGNGTVLNGDFTDWTVFFEIQGRDPLAASSAVPIPAAVWLFGSGLMGLIGVARRRKQQHRLL